MLRAFSGPPFTTPILAESGLCRKRTDRPTVPSPLKGTTRSVEILPPVEAFLNILLNIYKVKQRQYCFLVPVVICR